MKTIKVKLTKKENATFYGVSIGDTVEISLDEYLENVVVCEMGLGVNIEAYKAQAVASRTYAYTYYANDKPISDSSSSAQCFLVTRYPGPNSTMASQAVKKTQDELLFYDGKPIDTCVYSSSNGGRTTSSQSRWGGKRAYLIEQDDPWDYALSNGSKRGHGVGMSQYGAIYAASQGVSYRDILSFYYPKTTIGKEADNSKEESPMAKVKASVLIEKFKSMVDEKWQYVAGGARKGEVDCSGAFTYWYKQFGSSMYHGSNTMWRKWTTEKGKIGEINLLPGMAVFKVRDWSSAHASNGWYNTDPGDVYHVGLYVGNGKVVEAKGTKYGVTTSKLSSWHLAAKLKDTQYDMQETIETQENQDLLLNFPCMGNVDISGSYMNVRSGPGTSYPIISRLYRGDTITITAQNGDWYKLDRETPSYASKNCIALIEKVESYAFEFVVNGDEKANEIKNLLVANGVSPAITRT